ncbi:YmaF family protein [Paenibacillus sophorae]|uniref:YmaF family protein n=1 Tax=Paenibacillus sophorae TaxID=1333845 RepID=A0A1H8R060_9BACL|nr:YmaF family protein [Paenibacillus sophorae]QWU14898.1 YmaF family protein [Paenibacillus sophorae]SEO59835.1 YmaF family protein [Paenibacillus sophorae]
MQKKRATVVKKAVSPRQAQRHVHEFEGSTKLAEAGADRHNHRFAGVTGQAIRVGSTHVHEIDLERTDFLDHFHNLRRIRTGPAIPVGNGKHVHFVTGRTTLNDGHTHQFNFATLIESPLV